LMNALRQPYYVRKDGELIHVQGKRRFFEVGEVVESPRHPIAIAYGLDLNAAPLRYHSRIHSSRKGEEKASQSRIADDQAAALQDEVKINSSTPTSLNI